MTETPELETGYGPSSPKGDNLLNDFVQDNAASFAAFGAARGDRVGRVESVVTLIDAGSPPSVRSCSTARGRRPTWNPSDSRA